MIEERRQVMEAQREAVLRRKDLLKKTLAEKQMKFEAKASQLQQNEAHVRLERLENQLRQVEQKNQGMRSVIQQRAGDADFSAAVEEVMDLTDKVNVEAQRAAAL